MLIPNDFTTGMLIGNLRKDLNVEQEQSIFVFVKDYNGKMKLLKADDSLADIKDSHRAVDGFVYLYYQEIETMG